MGVSGGASDTGASASRARSLDRSRRAAGTDPTEGFYTRPMQREVVTGVAVDPAVARPAVYEVIASTPAQQRVGTGHVGPKADAQALDVEKTPERVFKPGRMNPIALAADSPTCHLMARLRDEVFDAVLVSHEGEQLDALDLLDGIRAGSSDEQPAEARRRVA